MLRPAADDSAVDACFADDFVDVEYSEADAWPAESASESGNDGPGGSGWLRCWRVATASDGQPIGQPGEADRLHVRPRIRKVTTRDQTNSRLRDKRDPSGPFPLARGSGLPGQLPGRPCKTPLQGRLCFCAVKMSPLAIILSAKTARPTALPMRNLGRILCRLQRKIGLNSLRISRGVFID